MDASEAVSGKRERAAVEGVVDSDTPANIRAGSAACGSFTWPFPPAGGPPPGCTVATGGEEGARYLRVRR